MAGSKLGSLTTLPASTAPADVARALAQGHGVALRGFPIDMARMLDFATGLGTPLIDYARLIPGEATTSERGLNVVKIRDISPGEGRTHHRAGELKPHTGRSWAEHRPRYFAMLMVEPGWRDLPKGSNGESLFVPWRSALDRMRSAAPEAFEHALAQLTGIPVMFQADNVRESVSLKPIIYPLPDATDPADIGVRVKQDLPDLLRRNGAAAELSDAVAWLQTSARELGEEQLAALEPGDLVVIDNNRWAHGRCGFEVSRSGLVSPREVWSTTIA